MNKTYTIFTETTMIDEDRVVGDVRYFTEGDISSLTPDSIYSRILMRDGGLTAIYPDYHSQFGDEWDEQDYYDYLSFWENGYGGMKPCIGRVDLNHEDRVANITFTRVCPEQFQYDIEVIREAFRLHDYTITFTGTIKDFRS